MKIKIKVDDETMSLSEIPGKILKFFLKHKLHTGFSMSEKQRRRYINLVLLLKPTTSEMASFLHLINDKIFKQELIREILSKSPTKEDVIRILREEKSLPDNIEIECYRKMIELNALNIDERLQILEKYPQLQS